MEFSAKAIAELLHGVIVGNPDVMVNNISKIEEGSPGTLTFLANPQYTPFIYTTKASIILVNKDFKPEKNIAGTLIRVEDSYQAIAKLLELYNQTQNEPSGIDTMAFIHATAKLGSNCYVGSFAYIGANVKIGNNVKIFPHVFLGDNVEVGDQSSLFSGVKIYHDCKISHNCILHSGVVIGGDGFGFAVQKDHNYKKVPQVGNVIVEENVEIGSNTTIDRATMGSTIIRKGVKLDNLVQIAHNVDIGENTVICAQTGVSGSAKIGKECMIGGQVGIVGHISIADNVKIAAQSGVGASIKEIGSTVQGSPAYDIREYQKSYVIYKNLPDIRKQIIELQKEIKLLKENH